MAMTPAQILLLVRAWRDASPHLRVALSDYLALSHEERRRIHPTIEALRAIRLRELDEHDAGEADESSVEDARRVGGLYADESASLVRHSS